MSDTSARSQASWDRAVLAAALFSVAPWQTGGVCLRARCGPVRDRWLELVAKFQPAGAPMRRVPVNVSDERLLGGIDLGATLAAGRPIAERGILAAAHGGILQLASAECLDARIAAHIAMAIDQGGVGVEGTGASLLAPARFGLVMLSEAAGDEPAAPPALRDRVAFEIALDDVCLLDTSGRMQDFDIGGARQRFASVHVADAHIAAICAAADALGVASVRATILAIAVARASAALDGRNHVQAEDIGCAAALVLAPRATRVPEVEAAEDEAEAQDDCSETDEQREPDADGDRETDAQAFDANALTDMAVAEAASAIPRGVLEAIAQGMQTQRGQRETSGRAGMQRRSFASGRPCGVRPGRPRHGARIDICAMLRAAAPWQEVRRRTAEPKEGIIWRTDDLRSKRFKHHDATATIFVVDASGSSALHRLGEAKGAVQLLLGDCYVRRDQVALIAFRGEAADILLPPTRSLVRAKRSISALPGGGGTPLAAAIAQAALLGVAARRKGFTPSVVFLTDGCANIGRDGRRGREAGVTDALAEARQLRFAGLAALVIDTSPRPRDQAAQLAAALGARYLPLPHADARTLSKAVKSAMAS